MKFPVNDTDLPATAADASDACCSGPEPSSLHLTSRPTAERNHSASGGQTSPPLSLLSRILLVASGFCLMAGFVLARQLEPAARGYGTHQQLGLPPCSIQFLFQIPCPSCGMTTSFAWYVRGQWLAAWQANPAGFYLAVVCSLLMVLAVRTAWLGRGWTQRRLERWAVGLSTPFVVVAVADWVVRLYWG